MAREVNHVNRVVNPNDALTKAFRNYNQEFDSKKDNLTNMIGTLTHQGESGAYRERVLAKMIEELLPNSVRVATGFVSEIKNTTQTAEDIVNGNIPVRNLQVSTQQDILVLKPDAFTFFDDGIVVVAPPESVLAAIEVKTEKPSLPNSSTNLKDNEFSKILTKQRDSIISKHKSIFSGVFFANPCGEDHYIYYKRAATVNKMERVIQNCSFPGQFICIGGNVFLIDHRSRKNMYVFQRDDESADDSIYPRPLKGDNLAMGYFLHNLKFHVHTMLNNNSIINLMDYTFPQHEKGQVSTRSTFHNYIPLSEQLAENRIEEYLSVND